jgi:hypothetical protein
MNELVVIAELTDSVGLNDSLTIQQSLQNVCPGVKKIPSQTQLLRLY